MNKILKEKTLESLSSVLPITIIVLILSVFIVPMEIGTIMMFMVGAALLIVGMGLFSLGADIAMTPMGEGVGSQIIKTKKLWLIIAVGFILGFIITVAEPDLVVLAGQMPSIPDNTLIYTVACGVGIFLVIAMLRVIFKIKLSHMLIVFYILLILISFFVPDNFVPVAFDSGGVTTGPITVPFIMAVGVGLSASRSDKDSADDSFGLVALSSIGPILAVLILGLCFNSQEATYTTYATVDVVTMQDVARTFAHELPDYFFEVAKALIPIIVFFLIFQLVYRRFKKRQLLKMGVGLIYTWVGLVLFLTGVNVGFIPVGHMLGAELADSAVKWILIPIGMLLGYYTVDAEPAVHVLVKQVEEVTNGSISSKAMRLSLSIGVAASLGLSMIRVLTGISIYWLLIPGYAIALLLTFFVDPIFTGIAFDSGGVASGPMTTTFILPFTIGACEMLGGNVLTDAFGVVAMVAMTPLIAIQIMGLLYKFKLKGSRKAELAAFGNGDDIIIDADEEEDMGIIDYPDEEGI